MCVLEVDHLAPSLPAVFPSNPGNSSTKGSGMGKYCKEFLLFAFEMLGAFYNAVQCLLSLNERFFWLFRHNRSFLTSSAARLHRLSVWRTHDQSSKAAKENQEWLGDGIVTNRRSEGSDSNWQNPVLSEQICYGRPAGSRERPGRHCANYCNHATPDRTAGITGANAVCWTDSSIPCTFLACSALPYELSSRPFWCPKAHADAQSEPSKAAPEVQSLMMLVRLWFLKFQLSFPLPLLLIFLKLLYRVWTLSSPPFKTVRLTSGKRHIERRVCGGQQPTSTFVFLILELLFSSSV